MAILDRPMFQRRMTKDQLRQYGLPAFANGGIVKMRNGGTPGIGPGMSMAMTGGVNYASIPRAKTAEELLEEKQGMLGKFVVGPKFKEKYADQARLEQEELEKLILQNAQADRERVLKDQADKEAFKLIKEKEEEKEEKQKKKEDDFRRSPAKEGSDTIDRSVDENIGDDEAELSDFEALKKKYLEKSELYKELLGNPKEMNKRQGFLQLAQFGLNLASAQGSNFLEKVAKSAKDPLNAFAELGRKAYEDERAVNLLALEATEKDIAAEKEAELSKELQRLKNLSDNDLTNFQKDLTTIKQLMPDLDELSQMKLAKGLKLPMDKNDRVDYYFEILSNSPIYAYDPSAARAEAERLTNQEFGDTSPPDVPTEEQSENLVTVTTQEDYDKVEDGQEYIYNGQVLTKGA